MKIYISADMEGITGVTHWNEVDPEKPDYAQFQKRMTEEVVSACRGALDAGAEKILVKDAHYTGRNILPADLPEEAELIRGWSGHPYSMVQELDGTFDALMMVGFHSRAGSGGNPLSHTWSSGKIERMFINGKEASEFLLHGYIGAKHGVPIAFVSGDKELCREVTEMAFKREKRMRELITRINEVIPEKFRGTVEYENVRRAAEGVLARPHLAKEMADWESLRTAGMLSTGIL